MAAALLAMAPSAQAQGTREARVRVALRGAFATRAGAFTEARPFTEFAERGEIDSRYTQGSGPGGGYPSQDPSLSHKRHRRNRGKTRPV